MTEYLKEHLEEFNFAAKIFDILEHSERFHTSKLCGLVIFLVVSPPDHVTFYGYTFLVFFLFLYRTDNCIVLLCECSHYLKLSSDCKNQM